MDLPEDAVSQPHFIRVIPNGVPSPEALFRYRPTSTPKKLKRSNSIGLRSNAMNHRHYARAGIG